jgi:subtilase family serine protease
MLHRFSSKFLVGAFAFGGLFAQAGQAQSIDTAYDPNNILKFVYHKAVCGDEMVAGQAKCFARIVTDKDGRVVTNSTTPKGFGPSDLRSAYNITANGSSSTTIAVVEAYGYPNAESDLAAYRSYYGLPACTTANGCFKKVNQTGGTTYPRTNAGWDEEAALDVDMASAMCPGCKILMVEAKTQSTANLSAAAQEAYHLGANVISNSYGIPESGTSTYESDFNHPGVAITVSTGDSGYRGGVTFPASSPHVTAVGGTSLSKATNSRGWSETAWSGAGSGCSSVYAKPTWQKDPTCKNRMVGDVSAVANPATGVAVYYGGSWAEVGGTSVSAPLVGGIYATNGGAANYGSDPYSHTSALYDITSGSTGSCSGTYYCTAVTGYDGPTGLGSPNGSAAFP